MENDIDVERFCQDNNIIIRCGKLPRGNRGISFFHNNHYLVFVSQDNSYYQQRKTAMHEIAHIFSNHFSCEEKDREKCEKEVHSIIMKLRSHDSDNDFEFVW